MFVSFFQAQHPQPSVYMRCQLQRLILRKFEYLAVTQATSLAEQDLLDEVKRLVHPELESMNSEYDSEHDSEHDSEPQEAGITHGIQSFVTLIAEVSLKYLSRTDSNSAAALGIYSCLDDESIANKKDALSHCSRLGCCTITSSSSCQSQ